MPIPDTQTLLTAFRAELDAAADPEALDGIRRRYAGKASPLKDALKGLRDVPADERPAVAKAINDAQAVVDAALADAAVKVAERALARQIEAEWTDVSLPGTAPGRGGRHPLREIEDRCTAVLRRLGFSLEDGPEVEHEYYNFDALNIPKHHPARDMQDTFWVTDPRDPKPGMLLRSHTTTVQARVLQREAEAAKREGRPVRLPIRVASAGRVYRNEAVDATHLAMFHQFEGIWIDRGLTFAHLKGVLTFVVREIYGSDRRVRFKPKFYPYTEPSAGVDLACARCDGGGCEACHGAGWVTILGSGMIHPNVFREFGYDPEIYSGIAFGFGMTRLAAQFLGVSKVNTLYQQDLRIHRSLRGER